MVQQLLSVDGSLSIYKQLLLYKGDRRFGHSVLVKASVCVCVCVCSLCTSPKNETGSDMSKAFEGKTLKWHFAENDCCFTVCFSHFLSSSCLSLPNYSVFLTYPSFLSLSLSPLSPPSPSLPPSFPPSFPPSPPLSLHPSFPGSASRRCLLDTTGVAYWGPPSFARCVSLEFRYLHLSVSPFQNLLLLLLLFSLPGCGHLFCEGRITGLL